MYKKCICKFKAMFLEGYQRESEKDAEIGWEGTGENRARETNIFIYFCCLIKKKCFPI